MAPEPRPRPAWRAGLVPFALCLLGAAILVRGIEPGLPPPPEDRPEGGPALAEPLQLLGRNGALRLSELYPRITPERRARWLDAYRLPFDLEGCPKTLEWMEEGDGQRLERLLADLRRGTREEALAALALLFQVARATEWAPGLFSRVQHAERLGGLLQEWLRTWGERASEDPLLHEPALAAVLLYGRVLRTAYEAPVFRRMQAPYDRARAFLDELLGGRGRKRTALGEAVHRRHPRAMRLFLESADFLQGFDEEARVLFPEIDGECGN